MGEKRKASGIEPEPRPRISQSIVQTTIFWKTMGWVHQSPMSVRPPTPGVVREMTRKAPTEKRTSLIR
jgi:hypothetical protein